MIGHDLSCSAADLARHVEHVATGTLRAQRFIDALRRDQAVPDEAVEEIRQLGIEYGQDSDAIAAFLRELAKRAAR